MIDHNNKEAALHQVYENFILDIENHIAQVQINRPDKANALDQKSWQELKEIFEYLDQTESVRVVVLSGNGKHFCAGIDLNLLMSLHQMVEHQCEGRKREKIRSFILDLQACINAIEQCRKPVIAAIHNGCIGGGVDIVAACDLRYACTDSYFCIKEIDMGMVADLGTLQRLPKIIPYAVVCEMAFTGRKVYADEAEKMYLINKKLPDQSELIKHAQHVAKQIASKAPIAVRGTKQMLQYSRDHDTSNALDYMATWNAAMLLSDDLTKAFEAKIKAEKPTFIN